MLRLRVISRTGVGMRAIGRRTAALLFLGAALVSCNRNAEIYNVASHNFATPSAPLAVRTEQIREAGRKLGWAMTEEGPGQMRAKLAVRSHTATVRINYTPSAYAIAYVDSTNLDASGTQIHKNYNGWVKDLEEAIYKRSASR
jgi:hypothetical protein